MKNWLKKLANRVYSLAQQYDREQLRVKFNLPPSVIFHTISLDGNVVIKEFTYLNEYVRIDSGGQSKVLIGKYCAIGRHVHITSKTHDLSQPTKDETHSFVMLKEADVVIGNYVWIGDKVTILPGVEIGDYSVIAAHAVVTKSVKPFEIVGGIPATHIRFNTEHYLFKST